MDATNVRVLSILTEMVARTGNVVFQLQQRTLLCDGKVLERAFGSVSESGYAARVRRLASRLGMSGVSVSRLTGCWDRAIQKGEPVTKEELIRLAHLEACQAAEISGPLGKWRQNVIARLESVWPELHHVERFDQPASTQARRKVLELFPIIQHWPETLLTGPDWAYAESPFGTIKPMPLDEVWVDIHFVEAEHFDDLVAGSEFTDLQDRRYKEQLGAAVSPEFVLEAIHGLVALVGAPGIGKTTFIKWLARQLIKHSEGRFLIPLVVPLRAYACSRSKGGMLAFAIQRCGVRDRDQIALWEDALNYLTGPSRNTVLLLLDGWDEVPAERHEAIRHEIEVISHGFTIVVTSRPSAFPRQTLPADKFYEITDLSPESITALVFRWFENVERPLQAVALMEHLDSHPNLRGLARNPFLLTILCGIGYNPDGTFGVNLPTTRTELYGKTVERLQATHPHKSFTAERLRQAPRLAIWLLDEAPGAPRYVFDRDDVTKCFGNANLLTRVLRPSRMLSQWGYDKETLHFIHTSFHEYLAACHLLDPSAAEQASRLLSRHVYDSSWHEVFCFLAGGSPYAKDLFWKTISTVVKDPDRFGFIYARLARFLREAGVTDGGTALLGDDLRKLLWSFIQAGIEPELFIDACLELDPEWFSDQVARILRHPTAARQGQLTTLLLRASKRGRTPQSSKLLLQEILEGGIEHGSIASYIDPRGLRVEDVRTLRESVRSAPLTQEIRRRSIRALGGAKDHQSIPVLVEIAKSNDPLAPDALLALAEIGGRRALNALESLLRDTADTETKAKIIDALGRTREAHARDRLLDELGKQSLDDPMAATILTALIDIPIGSDSAILFDFLRTSAHVETRAAAAWVLGSATEAEVAEALAHAAQNDVAEDVRFAALAALRGHVRPVDAAWLEQRACDDNCPVHERTKALEALLALVGRYGSRPDCGNLLARIKAIVSNALITPRGDLALEAATRSYLVGESMAPRLTEVCSDDSASGSVREAACASLGKIKDHAAVEVLLQLLRRERDVPSDEDAALTRVSQRLARMAAEAVAEIEPHALLSESGQTAALALAAYCNRNGYLAYTDYIRDAHGDRLRSPHDAEENRGEKSSETPIEEEIDSPVSELDPRVRKAHYSYEHAEKALEKELTDDEAFDWLRENGLADYKLPPRETWKRYLRVARNHLRKQKHLPRGGREGRSIVKPEDIDSRRVTDRNN